MSAILEKARILTRPAPSMNTELSVMPMKIA